MAGGGVQKVGTWATIVGALLVVAAIFTDGATLPAAEYFLAGGAVLNIAGAFITPVTPDTGKQKRDSRTYGFGGAQFQNALKGDAPIPFQYGRTKQAPIIVQAFTTPRGYGAYDDFALARRAPGQSLSMEMVGGEGPIAGLQDPANPSQPTSPIELSTLLINDRPAFDVFADAATDEFPEGAPRLLGAIPSGSGTYQLPLPGVRVYVPSIRLYTKAVVGGRDVFTLIGPTLVNSLQQWTQTSSKTCFSLDLAGSEAAFEFQPTFTVNGVAVDPDNLAHVRPYTWTDPSGKKLYVDTGLPMPLGYVLRMLFVARTMPAGASFVTTTPDAATRPVTAVQWLTRPTPGTAIYATYNRSQFPGVEWQFRYGGPFQVPLVGFSGVRQTFAIGAEVVKSPPIAGATSQPVDDLILDFASQSDGMHSIDATDGGAGPIQAIIRISYAPHGAPASQFVTLEDPLGASSGFSDPKPADAFAVWDDTTVQKNWSFSILGILRQLAEAKPSSVWPARLAAFTASRQRWDYSVVRINPVRHTSSQFFRDELDMVSRQEVLDLWLSHPGVWKIGFHGIASAQLNGQIPNVTVVQTGLASVKNIIQVSGVDTWNSSPVPSAARNPVYCACNLIASKVFGGGPIYSLDDIDIASAKAAAAWCDENVNASNVVFQPVTGLSVVAPNQFHRATGSFLVDGYYVGAWINAQGFDSSTNNGPFVITAVTATDLSVSASTLTTAVYKSTAGVVQRTEVRARLDYSGDTRQSLLAAVGEMLAPSFVIPVLQGDMWKFVIDRALTAAELATIDADPVYDDGEGPNNDTAQGSANGSHDPLTSDVTQLYVNFYDETNEWERNPVIVTNYDAPTSETTRVKRAEIRGCTRPSEATRHAQRLYAAATATPSIPGMRLTLRPRGIHYEAGDVFRFISNRLACDLYLRIVRMAFDFDKIPQVRLECTEYRPDAYAQVDTHARILAAPKIKATRSVPRLSLSVTRVA